MRLIWQLQKVLLVKDLGRTLALLYCNKNKKVSKLFVKAHISMRQLSPRINALHPQQKLDSTEELVEHKHRLLGHLVVIRRNQYFLEQAIASREKQTVERDEVPTSLWNLSMTSNLILAIKEVTAMLCSPVIRFDLSEKAYIHTMDAVQGKETYYSHLGVVVFAERGA